MLRGHSAISHAMHVLLAWLSCNATSLGTGIAVDLTTDIQYVDWTTIASTLGSDKSAWTNTTGKADKISTFVHESGKLFLPKYFVGNDAGVNAER